MTGIKQAPRECHLESIGNDTPSIPISPDEFLEVSNAREFVETTNGFEEKLYLLLENYLEFERELLELSLRRMVFADFNWAGVQNDLLTVNRRLANLLTASRLYSDQVERALTALFGPESAAVEAVRAAKASQYDAKLGYRVMEAIRNYLQHRGFPIHRLAYPMQSDRSSHPAAVAHSIRLSFDLEELRRDDKFKSSIASELEKLGDAISAIPLVREYVAGLGAVHCVVQSITATQTQRHESKLISVMESARLGCGASKIGYLAVAVDASGNKQEVQLFDDFLERRQQLARLCRRTAHLASHYVSGKQY